jgi:hypothetical protein
VVRWREEVERGQFVTVVWYAEAGRDHGGSFVEVVVDAED